MTHVNKGTDHDQYSYEARSSCLFEYHAAEGQPGEKYAFLPFLQNQLFLHFLDTHFLKIQAIFYSMQHNQK